MHYLGIKMCNTVLNTMRGMVNMTEIHFCLGFFSYITTLFWANRVMLVEASSGVAQWPQLSPKKHS